MHFYPCTSQHFIFGLVTSLSPALQSKIGSFTEKCERPYSIEGYTYTACRKNVSIEMSAGEPIGTAGALLGYTLDFELQDLNTPVLAYINPRQTTEGEHSVCPIDYFETSIRDALRLRISVHGVRRVIEPVCGTVMQDLPNTAQGRWFFDGTMTAEAPHLALVHDIGDPTIGAFSIGTSFAGVAPMIGTFAPGPARVNRDFSQIHVDGNIYCYGVSFPKREIFIQLLSATQLKMQVFPVGTSCTTAPDTWSFDLRAVTFTR
jgi:hypothetical protein